VGPTPSAGMNTSDAEPSEAAPISATLSISDSPYVRILFAIVSLQYAINMSLVNGHCDAQFEPVSLLLQEFLSSSEELGASLALNIDGKDVIDIWGGHDDSQQTRLWEEHTITNVASCTKLVTNLAALVLVDRGILDLNEKVSKYWPEFAAQGKTDIEVRHVLSHTSGLPGWDENMTVDDLYDWGKATTALARQAGWWKPGTQSGYQSFTLGFIVGELVRRTTGQTLKDFIRTEIAEPLGADFQLGVRNEDLPRVSDVIPPSPPADMPALDPTSIPGRVQLNPAFDFELANSERWRKAELGASNGHTNAAGLMRIMSALALGGSVNGHRLLSAETINLIFQEQAKGPDAVVGMPLRFGIGYGLTGKDTAAEWLPEGRICFWGGFGGSMVIMDLDRRMTISYVMNKLDFVGLGSERTKAYIKAIYDALDTRITPLEYGFALDNGTRIIHGQGSLVKDGFTPDLNIPGKLEVFSPGHRADPGVPCFCGPQGLFPFTTENRMPRHVHMSNNSSGKGKRYIVEKLHVLEGIALAELGGQIYVIPPKTLVLIGPGVPHSWTACPPGLDLEALGVTDSGKIVSEGRFTAVYEYEEPTAFYPTRQTETLKDESDYIECTDLQSIRFPKMEVADVVKDAWFVWDRTVRKLDS